MIGLFASQLTLIGYIAIRFFYCSYFIIILFFQCREGYQQGPFLLPLPVISMYFWSYVETELQTPTLNLSLLQANEIDQENALKEAQGEVTHVDDFKVNYYEQPALIPGDVERMRYRPKMDWDVHNECVVRFDQEEVVELDDKEEEDENGHGHGSGKDGEYDPPQNERFSEEV